MQYNLIKKRTTKQMIQRKNFLAPKKDKLIA